MKFVKTLRVGANNQVEIWKRSTCERYEVRFFENSCFGWKYSVSLMYTAEEIKNEFSLSL